MSSSSPDDNSLWFRSPIDNAFVVVNTQLFRSLFMDTYSETLYGIRHGTKFEFYTPNDQQNITAEKQLASGTFRGILREKESKLFLHFQEFLPLSAVNGMNASDAIEIAFEPRFGLWCKFCLIVSLKQILSYKYSFAN